LEVATVEAQAVEEEEAAKHVVPFSVIGSWVGAQYWALPSDDAVVDHRHDPSHRALKVIGTTAANKGDRGCLRELLVDDKERLVDKMDGVEGVFSLPCCWCKGEDIVNPGLAKLWSLFLWARHWQNAPNSTVFCAVGRKGVRGEDWRQCCQV
jgi:hypothetical protein